MKILPKRIRSFNYFVKNSKYSSYLDMYKKSINPHTREDFWKNKAQDLNWFSFPNKILDCSNPSFNRWFPDGKINMSYNCLDRHIEKNLGGNIAIIFESAYSHDGPIKITYQELLSQVAKLSKIFIENYQLKKGDRVIIYMPNIPEALVAMLACSRLGVIHSVVFGGFAAEELSIRIRDCKPKLIVTASVGIEPKRKIPYYPIVREALQLENSLGRIPILLYQRESFYLEKSMKQEDNYSIYQELMSKNTNGVEAISLNSVDPLYLLYTSGTTGSPKGVFRDVGGTCVALNFSMKNIMGIDSGDSYFATSDIGWVVGHSFIVYGPLLRGASTLLYEGKPIGTPNCGKYWELAQKHKIKSLFSSPTAIRAIKKEDPDGKIFKSYDLSALSSLHLAGERCDLETIKWAQNAIGEKLVNDNWWQTETGWPICSNYSRIETFPTIPGSASKPCPGYEIHIVDEESEKVIINPNCFGKIFIKLPMPPSFMLSLWGDDKAFINKYISKDGQYYITGDAGYFDDNGYLHIEARVDDVINVAGHRLSTGRIEEVIIACPGIVEAAVVSVPDEIKGEIPFAFVVCNSGVDLSSHEKNSHLKDDVKMRVATHIGAFSKVKDVLLVHRLPKTRSGKILRGVLKKILNREKYKLPSTIEDISVVDEIIQQLKEENFI
jgi:acyl-coenzyme A synthetase/AMP-(fatty) acid ligase